VADDDVFGSLDDGGEGSEGAGDGLVAVWEEGSVAADGIVCGVNVEDLLDVGALEELVELVGVG